MSNNHNTPSNPPNNHHPQMGVSGNYQNQNFMQRPFMPPNMQQQQQQQPPYINAPNQLHMSGLVPQNNPNYNPMFPVNAPPQMNFSQIQGQILAQNIMNLLQQPNMNMNMNVPNGGQFSAPYPMQNMNQQLPMQMQMQRQNPSQPVPYGMHPGQQQQQQPMFGFPNQVPHPMIPQNPMFSGNSQNSQFGVVPGNQVRPQIAPNPAPGNTNGFVSGPFPSQQLQGNSSVPHNTNNAQSSAFRNSHSQENPNSSINTNFANSNWKGSPNNNFKNKQNRGSSQGGFQKSKFRDNNKGNRRTKFPKESKGRNNERAGNFGLNSEEHQQQPKRSFSETYSEQEVLRWREARRKNHPSREKNEKKPSEQSKDSKCIDREVLQRELKEVLAKQAELGVEVAEIPSYYLKNAANQGQSEEKETKFNDKRKFKNKARRKADKRSWNGKKQKLADKDFLENKKKPTLLQKLLSADIKRDQSYLFQVFRFMTANSFFKDYPDKPLVYPSVSVKEMGSEVYDGKKHMHGGKVVEDGTKGILQRFVKDSANVVEEGEDDEDGDNGDGVVEFDEEEGEILE